MSNDFRAGLDAIIAMGMGMTAPEPEPTVTIETIEQAVTLDVPSPHSTVVAVEVAVESDDKEPVSEPSFALQANASTASHETAEQKTHRLELSKPIIGAISTEKMVHGRMILNGVCTNCVCCGMPLTDSVSVQRGLGPLCSSRGYAEDPTDPDEMGAFIELSEYPALVEFLTQHHKPLGVRGLMNGLVRIACLNRKSPVHVACCNAIDMLGYGKLANSLRNALIIGQIKDSEKHPGHHHIWIKRANWTRRFSHACGQIPNAFFDRSEKGWIVPKHPASRNALWQALMEHYPHEAIKTGNGPVKIPTLDEWRAEHGRNNH